MAHVYLFAGDDPKDPHIDRAQRTRPADPTSGGTMKTAILRPRLAPWLVLIAAASPVRLAFERQDRVALRMMSGYGIGIRDLFYGRSTLEETTRFVVEFALD